MESTMASRVEDIFVEVDNIMEEMRTYPVADIEDGFTDNDLMWLESNVRACLKQFMDMVWEDKYEDEMDATLKQEVERKVTKMRDNNIDVKLALGMGQA